MKTSPGRTRRSQKPTKPDRLPGTEAEPPKPTGNQPEDEVFVLAEEADGPFVPGPHWEGKTNFCPDVYWDDDEDENPAR